MNKPLNFSRSKGYIFVYSKCKGGIMKLTEDSKYEWCMEYCKLHGLDCVYYRDWDIAEKAYEDHVKSIHSGIYNFYKSAVRG